MHRQPLEDLGVPAMVPGVREGQGVEPRAAAALVNPDELFGVLDGEPPEEEDVHQAEDGRMGPDGQAQRRHGQDAEPGRLPQAPETLSEVLEHAGHRWFGWAVMGGHS